MRIALVLAALAASSARAPAQSPAPSSAPSPTVDWTSLGFAPSHVAAEQKLEQEFQRVPDAASIDRNLAWLASAPHAAGTPAAKARAERLRDELRALGFDAAIESFDVWLPLPKKIRVRLSAPEPRELETRELDPSAPRTNDPLLLGWTAYSASGRVEAPVVYAGWGRAEDYDALARAGVDARG